MVMLANQPPLLICIPPVVPLNGYNSASETGGIAIPVPVLKGTGRIEHLKNLY